jgi:hypothetical protein
VLLVREIRLLDADCALRLIFDAEVVVIHHPDCQIYRVFLEVYDQAVAVEIAVLIFVHLDTLVAVCALIDDAVLLEGILDLVFVRVARQVADVDSAVLLNLGLLVGLLRHVRRSSGVDLSVAYQSILRALTLLAGRFSLYIQRSLRGCELGLSQRVVDNFVRHCGYANRQARVASRLRKTGRQPQGALL